MLNPQFARYFCAVKHPGKIGQLEASMPHGTGDAKAGSRDFRVAALGKEFLRDGFEPRIFLCRKSFIANVRKLAILEPIGRQVDFRAAHIPGENHLVISSLPTPLASTGGSSAAASLSNRKSSFPFFGWIN